MALYSRKKLKRVTRLAQKLEDRLTWPVVIAALASIPAVFLTIWNDGEFRTAGMLVGWAAGAVLWAETIILLLAAERKIQWIIMNKWPIVVSALTLVTLIFALGGAQILRLVSLIGSLRFLRAKRIFNASRVLQRRLGLRGWLKTAVFTVFGLIMAVFVAVVLADPTGQHWELLNWLDKNWRVLPILVAGAILAVATWLVMKNRREEEMREREEEKSEPTVSENQTEEGDRPEQSAPSHR
ncbi:hypothetical protein [Haloglycomyces albus]|uniref:hypothetical protein n=1 Tax=Haloglycomyces albus TaxID=526067 RepID=UPI00046D50D5|nr:hypothetical protein [Haloglycomyces albus]